MKPKAKNFPFYLIFLAIYPSLSLLVSNIREVEFQVFIRPLLVCILFSIGIYYLHVLLVRDKSSVHVLTALFMLFFFNYGRIYLAVEGAGFTSRFGNYSHIFFMVIFVLLYLSVVFISKKRLVEINTLNVLSLVLVVVSVLQLGQYALSNRSTYQPELTEISQISTLHQTPDIYYIILDGYSREDTLEVLGFDNSSFLDSLRGLGFYIADCSQSNYARTALSLTSSFNLDFVWSAIPNDGPDDTNAEPVYDALVNNRLRQELKNRGYQVYAFETGFKWDDWKNADVYLQPEGSIFLAPYITPFEYLFLETTFLKVPLDFGWLESIQTGYLRHGDHIERANYVLETLPEIASAPGPKFIFAHIMVPHQPHVFLPDGSINLDRDLYGYESTEGYLNSIQFINAQILTVVESIIQNSETPPIIVIQGDHGYVIRERRHFILNAYYLPGQGSDALYSTITPVNTFRLIFNLYFGTDFPLRNDVSLKADIGRPYLVKREDFPEELLQCEVEDSP